MIGLEMGGTIADPRLIERLAEVLDHREEVLEAYLHGRGRRER